MRNLSSKKCPYEKLFMLQEIKNSIVKNVQWFWSGINVEIEKISLTSDQYISIFLFVIIKSQVEDIKSQLYLIEGFCTDD
mmetsp:Transcript_28500/g.27478  ORF Transcript_28500/g.27478 Transcript_28500/m.27478 type:complete len:80 (-) Transcript_28500:388-627(-)